MNGRHINIIQFSNGGAGYYHPPSFIASSQEAALGGKGWNAASRPEALQNLTARKEVSCRCFMVRRDRWQSYWHCP